MEGEADTKTLRVWDPPATLLPPDVAAALVNVACIAAAFSATGATGWWVVDVLLGAAIGAAATCAIGWLQGFPLPLVLAVFCGGKRLSSLPSALSQPTLMSPDNVTRYTEEFAYSLLPIDHDAYDALTSWTVHCVGHTRAFCGSRVRAVKGSDLTIGPPPLGFWGRWNHAFPRRTRLFHPVAWEGMRAVYSLTTISCVQRLMSNTSAALDDAVAAVGAWLAAETREGGLGLAASGMDWSWPLCVSTASMDTCESTFSTPRDWKEMPRTCTFDTLFFPQKAELLARVAPMQFDAERKKAQRRRLAILLHAEPGAGATSCIMALANALRRSVQVMPRHLTRRRPAYTTFLCRSDVFVCVLPHADDLLACAATDDSQADAAFLCRKLDFATDLCVLVACTSRPDAFATHAFDMVLRLGPASASTVLDIVAHCFQHDRAALSSAAPPLPDGVLSPAVVKDIALRAPDAASALVRIVARGQDAGRQP